MKARLTYVPVEVADQFEDFIIEREEQILDAVKARTKDFSRPWLGATTFNRLQPAKR